MEVGGLVGDDGEKERERARERERERKKRRDREREKERVSVGEAGSAVAEKPDEKDRGEKVRKGPVMATDGGRSVRGEEARSSRR